MSAPKPSPPSFSSFQSDKPLLSHLTIDLILAVLHNTLLNPFFVWLGPLALLAQSYQTHHPPVYWSIVYCSFVTFLALFNYANRKLAYGKPRPFDWTEEVVVVTGGSSGLGSLIAEVYGMRGVSVAVLDVKELEGSDARNVYFYKCDVGDPAQVEKARKQIEEDLGPVSVLINNAAVVSGKPLVELTNEDVERTFRTNIISHFTTLRSFLPSMLSNKRGTIVTVASVTGSLAPANLSDYSATKAAARALHFSLTAELASEPNIKTLLVSPGQLSTPLFAGFETPSNFLAPVLEPVEVAKEIISAIDKGTSGELAMPFYSRWVAFYHVMPVSVQRLLRWMSGMDRAMGKGFKGRQGISRELGDKI